MQQAKRPPAQQSRFLNRKYFKYLFSSSATKLNNLLAAAKIGDDDLIDADDLLEPEDFITPAGMA